MNRRPIHNRHAAAAREADRCQADYFRHELHHQIALLNEQSEVFRSALAGYERRRELNQVRRIQRELRSAVITRRKLADMLAALERRFPCNHSDLREATRTRAVGDAAPARTPG